MNANVKINIMISRDPIPYKEEYAQVSCILVFINRECSFQNDICCLILQKYQILLFISTATTTECDLCNKNGQCVISSDAQVSCDCRAWFAGRNCQINLKLLLIVGCVSVILMVVIACGVSCFCCRERGKNDIPCK